MRKIASLLTVSMLFCSMAFGQARSISGQVRDAQGNPVPFATVTERGTKNAVQADANGNYTIKVANNASLVVTATGYQSFTVGSSDNASVISLTRNERTSQLDEVVVTTLGQVRNAKELGTSVAKVKAAELTQAKVVNLQQGLTGKVSGLTIQNTNNGVFADTRITLRGLRSLTGNNQPMLIIDGVPLSLSYISSINPNDVADVSILKSSSATAVYGPEGANGAIVITTKRGNKNKPQITLSHTVQMESVSFMPELQTRFGGGSSQDVYGNGVYDSVENQGYGDEFDGSVRQIGRSYGFGTLTETYSAKPEAKKKFWDKGVTNQTDVSLAMGDFYLSAQHVDIKGVTPGDQNKRINLRMRADKEYNRLRASFNVNVTRSRYDITTNSSRDFSPYWLLLNTPMNVDITRFKNWRSDPWANPNYYFNDYYSNPYWIIDNYRTKGGSNELFGNIELNYKFTPWLNLTYRLGGSVANSEGQSTRGAFTYNDIAKASGRSIAQSGDVNASVADAASLSNRISSEVFASVNKTVGDFRFDGLVGQSYREIRSKTENISSNNLGQSTLYNVVLRKGEPTASNVQGHQRLQRFFGRLATTFRGFATVEVTGSYDMDSRLSNPYKPVDYKDIAFFYPGVNASFVLTEAIPALKSSNVLSYAKIRGAISKTGNVNLPEFALQNTYNLGTFFPYGNVTGFQSSGLLSADRYDPEFVKNREVGIELGFLRNRINVEATYYNQKNTNQIIDLAYSGATGFPRSRRNAASFTNKGIEVDLRLTPLVKIGQVNIDFKANYTNQDSRVDELVEGVDELNVGNANFAIVGKPAFIFKLSDYKRDPQGRVIVDRNTGMPSADPVPHEFGRTLPQHILGLSTNISWKGLTVSAVADYRSGYQVYAGNFAYALDFSGVSARSAYNGRRAFVFPNSVYADPSDPTGTKFLPNTDVYTQSFGYNFWSQDINTNVQSNYIASGAFWKLREVAITYTLPSRIFTGSLGRVVKGATIGINGRNLVTWLPKSNQWTDPEFSNSTSSNGQGVSDLFNTPPTRLFGANVTVNF